MVPLRVPTTTLNNPPQKKRTLMKGGVKVKTTRGLKSSSMKVAGPTQGPHAQPSALKPIVIQEGAFGEPKVAFMSVLGIEHHIKEFALNHGMDIARACEEAKEKLQEVMHQKYTIDFKKLRNINS
ncbi:hypothetical protein GH714_009158 [Hevea brasiliensis]|uniref:Uncharacterized protein n=1 Tax=Hevea brasiliensis TaxID=3981 RepID=A0A6A6MXS6_HEVBR|nr:hypothetical protein GH714_009158 [Hevea brasiliensis]